MKLSDVKVLDDKSRPGYIYCETKTGYKFWARITKGETTSEDHEVSWEQLRAIGMVKGMKAKSFSELTEEEKKLFTDIEDDNTEGEDI